MQSSAFFRPPSLYGSSARREPRQPPPAVASAQVDAAAFADERGSAQPERHLRRSPRFSPMDAGSGSSGGSSNDSRRSGAGPLAKPLTDPGNEFRSPQMTTQGQVQRGCMLMAQAITVASDLEDAKVDNLVKQALTHFERAGRSSGHDDSDDRVELGIACNWQEHQ